MDIRELHRSVVEMLKTRTYDDVGETLGISRAMVRYIETHPDYHPSHKMIAILQLDPSPDQLYTQTRQASLNAAARARGWDCLSDYLTAVLHEQAELPMKER